MDQAKVAAIVLAAGKGTRMRSSKPKVMHTIAGKPMLRWVIDHLNEAAIDEICLVLGGELNEFSEILDDATLSLSVAIQEQRRGTGDAVASAAFAFEGQVPPRFALGRHVVGPQLKAPYVLICTGDVPNIKPSSLAAFCRQCRQQDAALGVMGMIHPRPTGYGRLVVDDEGHLVKIVEEKDANAEQKALQLCNSGVIFARRGTLFDLIDQLRPDNSQGEYYLTDCFALARDQSLPVVVWQSPHWQEFEGVNDPQQLARVEELILQSR